ncbi:hypothetical protein C8Z91_16190 [Paenibacillus elgii]|uniref:Uncharacterized protein n=1 Tax=Paenibacillus elgii TaxID=189691 RepID=A0A2T6G271_9BACL|nr:hypothetical protein C8Z91_16190 [Paenibacillus elgii]
MTNIIQSYQNQRFIKSSNESPSVRFIICIFILLTEGLLCKGKGGGRVFREMSGLKEINLSIFSTKIKGDKWECRIYCKVVFISYH